MTFPDDCRYTNEHEWIRVGDDGLAAIGVTDFAQGELGDIVFIEIEPVGTEVGPEDVFGTVEAVKTVSELFAPVAGVIEAINELLEDAPETVNSDPYVDGWMVKIRPANPPDLDGLMTADEYKHMVGADS